MTATFNQDGPDLEIIFTYRALTEVVQGKLEKAAEYLWNHGYGETDEDGNLLDFSSLSNQEKLDLVDRHLKRVILDMAVTWVANEKDEDKFAAVELEKEIIFD